MNTGQTTLSRLKKGLARTVLCEEKAWSMGVVEGEMSK